MSRTHPIALVILDGWGHSDNPHNNPIISTPLPTYTYLLNTYPHTYLEASGIFVGLPPHTIGNSAVGHFTIGAGKRIKQPLTKLLELCKTHELEKNTALLETLAIVAKNHSRLHIIGLLTDAGVHGHIDSIIALLKIAADHKVPCFIHAILDGRDTPSRYAATLLTKLEETCTMLQWGSIASIQGRWYAMDRDMSWNRISKSINMLVGAPEKKACSWQEVLNTSYTQGLTDEFIKPTLLVTDGVIQKNDGLIITNTREDRARQLTAALINYQGSLRTMDHLSTMPQFHVPSLSVCLTAIEYHPDFHTKTLIQQEIATNTLGDALEAAGLTQFTIAESEKYAHVTYFFNGGKEIIRPNETRVVIPSPKVKSFDETPEMSAAEITRHVMQHLAEHPADFYLINYANADMVGHTGNIEALKKALVCLDEQLNRLYKTIVLEMNGTLIITADHGNAEDKRIIDGMVSRSHTTNKVPLIVIQKENQQALDCTELADLKMLVLKFLRI